MVARALVLGLLLLLTPGSGYAQIKAFPPRVGFFDKSRPPSYWSLRRLLKKRRSVRYFSAKPLSLSALDQLLWAAQGVSDKKKGLRVVPSAGALYPLEVLLVAGNVSDLDSGVYRYMPRHHRLRIMGRGDKRQRLARAAAGQSWVATAPAVLVLAGVVSRTAVKYGKRARRYVLLEAGHASQNLYLAATTLGLGTTFVGAFDDAAVAGLLQLKKGEEALAIMPVGWPR